MAKQKTGQQQVEEWNAANPVGTAVLLQRDNGDIITTKTRSAAWLLSGHSPVVQVEGIAGAYFLPRVKPVKTF